MKQHSHVLKALQSSLWAITPEALNQVIAIAQGFGDPEAVAARLGKPLTNTHDASVREGVALVPVIGPIFRYADLFTRISGATSIQTLATDLQTAVDDPAIKAIILEIDSPGGQVAGVSEFADQIRAANAIKPVTAYISDIGASAAYWIAAAAGEIVVSNTARLGSIGVVMQATINDEEDTIKFISSQSPLKHADPASDTGKAQNQKTVDNLAEVFINAVADYRTTTREAVIANFGLGGMHIASDAIAVGMADRLGSLESLIAELSNSKTLSTSSRQGKLAMNQPQTLTKESLFAEQPDFAKALTDEYYQAGLAVGIAQGAEAERVRIQGIEALATLGHDDLIATFKYDGRTTAADAALQILSAEKLTRLDMAEKLAKDTPKPVPHAQAAFNDGGDKDGETDEDEAAKIVSLYKPQKRG
jgi:ClpP class serine protease